VVKEGNLRQAICVRMRLRRTELGIAVAAGQVGNSRALKFELGYHVMKAGHERTNRPRFPCVCSVRSACVNVNVRSERWKR
jgi:hypothetical protein